MSTPTTADLLALLRRAEVRDREAQRDATVDLLGGMFADADAKAVSNAFGANAKHDRDRLRSESEGLRLNELEMARLLGNELSEAEEAEREDLAARRTETGYIAPPTEGAA